MGRCRSYQCPDEVDDEDEAVFCSLCWDSLPQEARVWLFDSWGSSAWPDALAGCIRLLRETVARARANPPW